METVGFTNNFQDFCYQIHGNYWFQDRKHSKNLGQWGRGVTTYMYPDICRNFHLSVNLSPYLSIYLSIYLYVYLSVHQYTNPSIYRSIYRSIYPCVYLPTRLSSYAFMPCNLTYVCTIVRHLHMYIYMQSYMST